MAQFDMGYTLGRVRAVVYSITLGVHVHTMLD